MRLSIRTLVVLGALSFAACTEDPPHDDHEGDDGGPPCPENDAGPEPEQDSGVDAGEDSGVDGGVDAGEDSGVDGSVDDDDAGVDAGPEPDPDPVFEPTSEELAIIAGMSPIPALPDDPTNIYADNPDAAELGQAFFFDQRFSGAITTTSGNDLGNMGEVNKISCSSCHNGPYMDDQRTPLPRKVSLGANFHTRNAPTAVNSVFYTWTNWGGRFSAPWELPIAVAESGVIMNGSRLQVAHVIYDNYKTEYEAVFGTLDPVIATLPATGKPKSGTNPDGPWELVLDDNQRTIVNRVLINFGKAIEAYERLLISGNAPFDAYVAGDDDAISEDAKWGMRVFLGKGRCVSCHNGPMLTDNEFHNIGVPQPAAVVDPTKIDDGRFKDMPGLAGSPFSTATSASDDITTGRLVGVVNPPPADLKGRFRTPSLRGTAETAPFTHAGELATLHDVVDFYNIGGATPQSGKLDSQMFPLFLTEQEQEQLVEFLESLSGETVPASLRVDSTP